MSRYIVSEKLSSESWNSFLNKFTEGNFPQCYEYGEIAKIANPRTKVVRLSITYDGKPVGIVQGIYPVYFGFGTTLRVDWGPIMNPESGTNFQLVGSLLSKIEDCCRRRRIIHAQFLVPDSFQLHGIFNKMNYVSSGKSNEYIVNLKEGPQQLWMNIHHNKRRNIKRALEKGVEISQSHRNEDLKTFYSLLEASAKRREFSPYPHSMFESIWKTYKTELSKVFLAHWKGKIVSGVFVAIHGRTVYALGAGSFPAGWEARPNDLLHWKVMEWASENGYFKYNMGGVDEPPPSKESAKWGIWRWKKEWKGSLEKIETFNKIILPQYKLLLKARDLVAKGMTRLN